MKRFLLYTILFFLYQLGYGQVTVLLELMVEGQSTATDEISFKNADLEWTVTNTASGCMIAQDEAYRKFTVVDGGVAAGGFSFMMIDMNIFDACGGAVQGQELIFDMRVVNPNHAFYGYTAKKSFIVPPWSIDEVLRGEDAINFTAPGMITKKVTCE